MRSGTRVLIALIIAAATVIGACTGGATGDPVGTVKTVVGLVEAKQFDKVADYACAAKRQQVTDQFDLSKAFTGAAEGVDPKKIVDGMTIKFENLEVKEVSRSGDKATVSIKGKVSMKVDPAVLREIVRDLLKQQGIEATDQMVDAALNQFSSAFDQSQDMDETVALVNEGGKWLICED